MVMPRYVSPQQRDYIGYTDSVKQFNHALLSKVSSVIGEGNPNPPENLAFATTGSDGRYEKGPQSKIDLVSLYRGCDGIHSIVDATMDDLDRQLPDIVIHFSQRKQVDSQSELLSEFNRGRYYPTRISDAKFLYGNEDVFNDGLANLVEEIRSSSGRKLVDFMNSERRRAFNITKTGQAAFKKEPVIYFDLQKGESYYDENEDTGAIVGSFKYGPLRLVQYKLSRDLMAGLRNDVSIDLKELPRNISDRLFYVEAEDLTDLTTDQIGRLSDNYRYFLWQFHLSQDNYRNGDRTTPFEAPEVRERLIDLLDLVDKPLIINRPRFMVPT